MTFISREEIASMVKMANNLDEAGHVAEAAALDSTIQKLVLAAEKAKEKEDEEEKEAAGLSNKQRAALKAFRTSAERVTKVFGNRIPRSCKKLDDLAEQVLEACETCDLGE